MISDFSKDECTLLVFLLQMVDPDTACDNLQANDEPARDLAKMVISDMIERVRLRAGMNPGATRPPRYEVDTTKAVMETHPSGHSIIDTHAGDEVVAVCPLTSGSAPVCEGAWSYAPLVLRALENEARGRAAATVFAKVREL